MQGLSWKNTFYFIILFLLLSVIVSKLIKEDIIHVMSLELNISPLLSLPPYFICFFFQIDVNGYSYAKAENFFYIFKRMVFFRGDGRYGISIEILLGQIFIASYIYA